MLQKVTERRLGNTCELVRLTIKNNIFDLLEALLAFKLLKINTISYTVHSNAVNFT